MPTKNSGFTLIELLVVIAIIAILAAILFPVFARVRAKAQQNSCLANTKQLSLAIMMYASDYDDKGVQGNGGLYWQSLILPYVKNTQIFVCPSDVNPRVLSAPVPNPVQFSSFGQNDKMAGLALSVLDYPAEMLGVIDSVQEQISWNATLLQVRLQVATDGQAEKARHNKGGNATYMDGHAKWLAFLNIPDPAGGSPPDDSPAKHFWQGID